MARYSAKCCGATTSLSIRRSRGGVFVKCVAPRRRSCGGGASVVSGAVTEWLPTEAVAASWCTMLPQIQERARTTAFPPRHARLQLRGWHLLVSSYASSRRARSSSGFTAYSSNFKFLTFRISSTAGAPRRYFNRAWSAHRAQARDEERKVERPPHNMYRRAALAIVLA